MSAYASARALASRLIQKKGRPIAFSKNVDGPPPDPNKPWRPGIAVDQAYATAVPAVFLQYQGKLGDVDLDRAFGVLVGRALVPGATEQAYVSALAMADVRPEPGHILVDGDRNLEVVELEVLAPGDADVLYVVYLKE